MQFRDDPLIIGALGGSGTRVFARIAMHAGVHMGVDLNESEDAMPLSRHYKVWNRVHLRYGDTLTSEERTAIQRRLLEAVDEHLAGIPRDAPWGAKNPESINSLEILQKTFPRMRFIHILRNGLDMIYSANRSQFDIYHTYTLTAGERRQPLRLQLVAYWSKVNSQAADFGEANLGDQYLRIRYEDMFAEPEAVVSKIFRLVGQTDETRFRRAVAEISPASTIGRWRMHAVKEVRDVMRVGRPALERFGYWNPRTYSEIEDALRLPSWRRWIFQRTGMRRLPVGALQPSEH